MDKVKEVEIMKQLMVFGIAVILLGAGGCGQQTQLRGGTQEAAFPKVMVGVWEANISSGGKWGVKFEPDGSIKKIIHASAGLVDVTEGGVSGGTEANYYIVVMGPCEARYMPETRMLKVKIIVEHFIISTPAGKYEERIEDYFEGPVSEDGKKWIVDWRGCSQLEGDPNVIEGYPEKLVFSRVDDAQIMKEYNGQ
jgi:hypothetical protein